MGISIDVNMLPIHMDISFHLMVVYTYIHTSGKLTQL